MKGTVRLGELNIFRLNYVPLTCYICSFDHRFRIYDISDYGEQIKTYKRLENDEIVDEMVLVGRGAPLPYEQ